MWDYLWPMLIVVGSNVIYNICTKSTPADANAFASLSITYSVSAVVCFVIFLITKSRGIAEEISKLNWTSVLLGISIIGLEFGYIAIYRAGWKMSVASITANISLACVLLLVGVFVYKEHLSVQKIAGMAVCAAGLVLLNI